MLHHKKKSWLPVDNNNLDIGDVIVFESNITTGRHKGSKCITAMQQPDRPDFILDDVEFTTVICSCDQSGNFPVIAAARKCIDELQKRCNAIEREDEMRDDQANLKLVLFLVSFAMAGVAVLRVLAFFLNGH